ncbi:hypothetical protein ACN47E_006804 [Coniothyrium glycines]
MEIPRGHAAMPLTEADFLDFIYNYFKAEYAPIRSFWSTATAFPNQTQRWISMGHEVAPTVIRPANAQAQKDLESLDYFTRKWNLDTGFVRGLVIRFAKYEVHERLEKKLYEVARLDLMVRKSLKEKHLIDALWPSPAPRNLPKELLQQGVQVRQWYGDMFHKYFRVLHSIESFELRPEVDQHVKSSGTLMLIPFVDHLIFGTVDPIMPIVAKGSGYSNARTPQRRDRITPGFGEPDRFEIRFDAPAEVSDTYTKSVVRQCQCMKCGSKRDVQVVISIDPNPNGGNTLAASAVGTTRTANTSSQRRSPRTTQRYSPGYEMPGEEDQAPRQPPRPQRPVENIAAPRPTTPDRKKQCPRCTFLNHPELTVCEMCQANLPDETVMKPPSPATVKKTSHSHSASVPPLRSRQEALKTEERPAAPNRHSLSSSLFSIFPFNQQHQQEHHAKLPPTQQVDTSSASQVRSPPGESHGPPPAMRAENVRVEQEAQKVRAEPAIVQDAAEPSTRRTPPPSNLIDAGPETPLSRPQEMVMMPLTPPSTTSASQRLAPIGLPSNLMDDFVPVSPAIQDDDNEDAGWGEVSKNEAQNGDGSDDEGEVEGRKSGGFIDLDAVAREEADVWGDRDD